MIRLAISKSISISLLMILLFDPENSIVSAFKERDILKKKFSDGKSMVTKNHLKNFQNQLRNQIIRNLHGLPENEKLKMLEKAKKEFYNEKFNHLTATDYMEYFYGADRMKYQVKFHDNNHRLAYLVMGQLLLFETDPSKDIYMNEIVNGIWMLMEMSTWALPAHLRIKKNSDKLPYPNDGIIDLEVGETVASVAWIKLLLQDSFDKITPAINIRIDYEFNNRIWQPYLHDYQRWEFNQNIENWNIWCNTNIFKSAILTLDNADLFNKIANLSFYSVDFYISEYAYDGNCNEGVAYWRDDGGRLIEYLGWVADFYDVHDYFNQIPLIQNIGEYVIKMHIKNDLFVNFGDAHLTEHYPPTLLYRFGELFNDTTMKQFGSYMSQYKGTTGSMDDSIYYVNYYERLISTEPQQPGFRRVWYMADTEVLTTKSKTPSELFLGAKFGTTDGPHKHNDVGNFILFYGITPILIDIGVGFYNATSFGPHRYDILWFQSDFHNCPTINGQQQIYGEEYKSKNVAMLYDETDEIVYFIGDIAPAYSNKSYAKKWLRTMEFHRKIDDNQMILKDEFELEKFIEPQRINFITTMEMNYTKMDYGLLLSTLDQSMANKTSIDVEFHFNWNIFNLKTDKVSLDNDTRLMESWNGDHVNRIQLETNENYQKLSDKFEFVFKPQIKPEIFSNTVVVE